MIKNKINPTNKNQMAFLVIAISLIIAAAGYWFYDNEISRLTEQKQKILSSIATIKSQLINDWYKDELHDVSIISEDPALLKNTERVLSTLSPVDKNKLTAHLKQIKNEHDYVDVILASPSADIIAETNAQITNLSENELKFVANAVIDKNSFSTDLFKHVINNEEKIFISFISAVKNADNKTTAVLICRMDPNRFLFPLVENWPTPSKTAESFIFKVENDSILYLNNLRHLKNTAVNLKIPIIQSDLPASKAANGFTGIIYGKDYRNVDVTAYATKIEGTSWYMITKVDKSELFEEVPVIVGSIAGFVVLGILITAFAMGFIYNQRQKTIYRELYSKEKEIWQQQEKFKVTMDSLGESIIVTDMNAKVQYINSHAEELTGWRLREARGRLLGEIYSVKNEKTGQKENNILEKVIKHGIVKELANHTILISKNGKEVPVMDTGAPVFDLDGSLNGIVISFQDETERRTQKKLLEEKEAFTHSILSSLSDHIAVIDNSGKIIVVNAAWNQFALQNGVTSLERTSIGTNYFDVCNKAIAAGDKTAVDALKGVKSVLSGEKNFYELEYPCHSPEKQRWFVLRVNPFVQDKNKIVLAHIDVTDRKLAEDELFKKDQLLNSVLETQQELIARFLPDTTITFVNKAYCKLFCKTEQELLGRKFLELVPESEWEYNLSILKSLDKNNPTKTSVSSAVLFNGSIITIEWTDTVILNEKDEVVEFQSVGRDITEKNKMVNELIAAKEKAEEINRLKSSFLANMSHELRTPLIGIIGFADFLMQDLDDPGSKEMAENIYLSGNRLSETLNLILDLSKFESEKMEFHLEKVDLVKETNEILKLFSKAAEKQGLYLKSLFNHPSILIFTDGRAYRTILNNLINNAIKFTCEGGVIVDVSVKENCTEIKVKDTGIGIAEEYHDIIFEEFRQVSEGHSRNFEGAGLGLNITKKLVDKFGGEISVESTPGKGSTFIVKLPLTAGDEISEIKAAVKQPEKKHISASPKVKPLALLVDDDPLVHPVLKRYLAGQIELETAADGELAIKLCNKKKYDLVFIDINLKRGMDGKQVTRELRKLKEYESIPIIAVTAYAMVGDREEFLEAGCSHYLSKPFKQQDVLNLIGEIFSQG